MENERLIRKIVWSFHLTTGLDPEDLFQEAYLAYVDGMKLYNPNKGAITTYMWYCVTSRLKNYLKQEDKHRQHLLPLIFAMHEPVNINPIFEDVSQDVAEFIESVVKINDNVVPLTRKNAVREITKGLSKEGWNIERIIQTITDVKSLLVSI